MSKLAKTLQTVSDAAAERFARADAQDYGAPKYHGSTHDIEEFDGSRAITENDWGRGTYLSDSIDDVNTNYARIDGPDLKARMEQAQDRIVNEMDDPADFVAANEDELRRYMGDEKFEATNFDDLYYEPEELSQFAWGLAKHRLGGGSQGAVYELRVRGEGDFYNTSDPVKFNDREELLDGIDRSDAPVESEFDDYDEYEDALIEWEDEQLYEAQEDVIGDLRMVFDRYDLPEDVLQEVVMKAGDYGEGFDAMQLRDAMAESNVFAEDLVTGEFVSHGQLVSEFLQARGFPGIIDPSTVNRFDTMGAGEHTIVFPGHEDRIRSTNAQFDSTLQNSRNILAGGAAAAVGIGAAGSPNDAEAAVSQASQRLLERREQKRSQYAALRQKAMRGAATASGAIEQAFASLDIPMRGLVGLSRVAGGLIAGETIEEAMNQGANQVRQPLEQTADQLGEVASNATGSPAVGAAVNAGIQLGGPI